MKKKPFKIRLITMFLAVMLIIIGLTPINVHAAGYGKYESNGYYVIAVEDCIAYFGTIRCSCMSCALVNGDNTWWNCNHSGEISVGYFDDVRCNYCRAQCKIAICKKDSTDSTDHAGVENGKCKYCGQDIHVHTYATTWTYDSSNHWHVATCEHTELKLGEAAHTFGDWENGVRTCECGYTETCSHDRITGICGVCGKDLGSPTPNPDPVHVHTYATTWTYDSTNHWHVATCEHTELKLGEAAHTFGDWENGVRTCECGYTETCSHDRITGICGVCGKDLGGLTPNPDPVHVHTYATTWTYDSTNHWHVATCEHTELKSDKAAHTLSDWNNGVRTCECGYTETCSHDRITGICGVCGKDLGGLTPNPDPVHVHTYATTWTYDSTNHWHVATCEHTELKSDKAAHTLSDWNNGVRTCECGYTETCSHDRITGICGVCGKDLGSPTPNPEPSPSNKPSHNNEPSKTELKEKEAASVGTPNEPSKSVYEERIDSLVKEISLAAADAKKTGRVKTIYLKDVTSLSLSIMKALKDSQNVILDMTYTYKGVGFHITIPGGSLVYVDESIPWYGPVWLYTYYGKGLLTNATENAKNVYIVQSGDTLRRISSELSVPFDELIKKNPQIKNVDKILIGDKIKY